jgi:hypothetical protein
MTQTSDFERRLARLEAIEDIRRLKQAYAGFCDEGYPPDKIAPLFTEDAVFDGGPFGVCNGRDEVHAYYAGQSDNIPWALHYTNGDSIEVADDLQTAVGTWYLSSPLVLNMEDGAHAVWVSGRYVDHYRKVDGEWKFAHVKFTPETVSKEKDTWHPNRFAIPTS